MFQKVFINIFFEKRRTLVAFMSIIIILLMYIGVQTVFYIKESNNLNVPDVTMSGRGDEDGEIRFKLYKEVLGLSKELDELLEEKSTVYSITARNILTVDGIQEVEKINYWIYGVSDSFFEQELKDSLKEGALPQKGMKEIIIGSYTARKYNAKVGELIDLPITLKEQVNQNDLSQYKVVGILNDNISYFRGALFISKETFKKHNPDWAEAENMVFAYFNNSSNEVYEEMLDNNPLISKYNIGSISNNYIQKQNSMTNILINALMTFGISCIILFLLISYIMKGISKKIGLLKALGISDKYINKVFIGGMGLFMLLSLLTSLAGVFAINKYLNYSFSKFLGYKVVFYIFNMNVVGVLSGVVLLLFIITFFTTRLTSSRISPRDAMLKV
ncbi:FtsX-like permease family protein [Alkaliphilus hydrothermalis]|uniref:ABC-type antimicrobial peptide transport system permease subunit n=1 Tax=Alkaliphilus hydrothermalis TaxID=1482730 RepID=A0ABS2NLZ4_9FIRM|nr:FtsX-like permease family protein [Alkaliphilus hydrothermalis]MBM7613948.1 ABC-type antimicrobial peptide transport system permease subunit [Alkaliphilus hydrothermalis]